MSEFTPSYADILLNAMGNQIKLEPAKREQKAFYWNGLFWFSDIRLALNIQPDSLSDCIQTIGCSALVQPLRLLPAAAYQEWSIGEYSEIFNIEQISLMDHHYTTVLHTAAARNGL